MKKIAFIPIDNRPICYTLPIDIANVNSDIELILPDRKLLGGLYTNSDIEGIFSFLENLEDMDYLVLSLDTIAYGGLVTSRRTDDTLDIILNRVKRLEKVIKKLNAKVFAFSSIMRISNNNINEEEKEYWNIWGKKIFEYSYALHKSRRLMCANCVINTIPKDILEDYINTRNRNFEVNKYYLNLVKDGIINTLIYSKDDSGEFGLNVEEAEKLAELSKDNKNVFIKTGADEIPLSLFTRAVAENKEVKIGIEYLYPDSKQKISKYEDIPLENNILAQIDLAGAKISDKNDCDLIFYINNFEYEQGDHVLGSANIGSNYPNLNFDKPFFIADVNNANGADSELIKHLFSIRPRNFMGYAGYNTSANSIGCALSIGIIAYLADMKNVNAFKKLNFIRFLDDWAYQAVVRKQVREDGEKQGIFEINPYIEDFKEYENAIKNFLNYNYKKISYSLPWNRSFEIEIEVND